jgi:hypothetical protein
MAVGRVVGWIGWISLYVIGLIFFLAGLWVLVDDFLGWVDYGHSPITLYGLWWGFHPSSLNLLWRVTRYIPFLWDQVIFPVLSSSRWWAFAVLIGLGFLILRSSARGLTLRTLSACSSPVAGL